MNGLNINASMYPAAKFTFSLTVHEANSLMFRFLGEHQFVSLYKIVREEDLERLQAAVEKCIKLRPDEELDECIQLQNQQGEYEKCFVILRKYEDEDFIYLELRNISGNEKKTAELKRRLALFEDLLTLNGKAYFLYSPEDDRFHLFWMDYSQMVDICDQPLQEWRRRIVEQKYVADKDVAVFESFCDTLARANSEQSFLFSGKILSYGDSMDGYKIHMVPREYQEKKLVLGVWSVFNIKTHEETDDYLEGTFVDSLTKTLNKKSITEYALKNVKPGVQAAVAIVDLDYFKNVNDTYGHLFGDEVIKGSSDVMKKVVGGSGMVGRIGGDEFLIILKDYGDEAGLRSYLRGIRTNIGMLFLDRVGENRLSCSIGAAQCGVDSNDYNELFRIADKALYIAKQKGRNRFVIYDVKKHGKFHMTDVSSDMTEIRDSFFSEKDMGQINRYLADMVLNGSGCMPELLELMVHTIMTDRIVIFWGKDRKIVGQYPKDFVWEQDEQQAFEDADYLSLFKDDLMICTNTNFMEYSQSRVFSALQKQGVLSCMQFLLRDRDGEVCGMVILEACVNRNSFPKLAMQLFENMCRIINAVLIKEST
ncbi:MAG: GGDEF domain-containing protein [Blautia sp.]|nr:GGDEF domain-containing protein [Blautia sp.]